MLFYALGTGHIMDIRPYHYGKAKGLEKKAYL